MPEENDTDPRNIPEQPGSVISPDGLSNTSPGQLPDTHLQEVQPAEVVQDIESVSTAETGEKEANEAPTDPAINEALSTDANAGNPKLSEPMDNPEPNSTDTVSWTASEFVAHDKAASWYLGLGTVTIIFAGLVYLLTRDIISVTVIIVAAIILGVYASNKPRKLEYRLDRTGLNISGKFFPYEGFKSFSVLPEGPLLGITFMPLKRFMPLLTVYYEPKDEDGIMKVLSQHLPYDEPKRDTVDSLMRRIRF